MISRLIQIFAKPISIKDTINVENKNKLKKIITHNRNTLKTYNEWLGHVDWKNSYYGYGVPEQIYPLLDLDIGEEMTYTDLISYYSQLLPKANYLELGVSVGKNFMQLAEFFENASLTGFDIENINPTILNKLCHLSTHTWQTKNESLRTEPSYLSSYKFNTNTINYLAGDIWDEVSWKKLQGNKFNLIFSDALHDPKALIWEYEMIRKYDLLDNDFLFFWDDLNNGLENSFKEIAADLLKKKIINKSNIHLIKINGWMGKNEIKHDVGIVSTFNLSF